MLLQNSPFRDFDSLFEQFSGRPDVTRPAPMDAYRRGDDIWVHIDLPGVAADSIDVNVERNVLTITAERSFQREEGDRLYIAERHRGSFRRQVTLGEGLDSDNVEATYHDGVLTLRIPVAPQAKPRKIEINAGQPAIDVTPSDAEKV
jgi:HSP20 family protein